MIDQHNSLAEKFLKKGIWLYIFSFIVAPLGYIIKIIVSGELSVEEIGIIYGVMSLMVLLNSFNDLGMSESLNKFIPDFITQKRYDKVKSILWYALLAQVVSGGILFLLFYFGADFLSLHYFKDPRSTDIVKLFAFFFLGTTFFHVINVFFQAVQNTFLQKLSEFCRMGFIVSFTLYMFLSDQGNIFTYSLSWVLGLYFGILVSILLFYHKYYKVYLKDEKIIYSRELFGTIFRYAIIVFLGSQASHLLSQVDMQMIIYLLGNKDAGYYTNYLSIIGIPFMIIGPIFGFLFPVFSEMIAKNEQHKIKIVKSIFTKNFLSFSISFSVLFLVFGTVIATILFGEKFYQSGLILQSSILFLSFNFLLQINFNILAANGKIKERLRIILIALLFNTIGNIVLIGVMGVAGAAVATGLGWVLIWYLSERILSEYKSPFEYTYLAKNIGVFSSIGIFLYLFIVPLVESLEQRMYQFWALVGISILYFCIYFLVNIADFKYFYKEIKMIKKR